MRRFMKAIAAIMLMAVMLFDTGCTKPDNSNIIVSTDEIHDETGESALGGGNVVSKDGSFIITKGICWSVQPQPTTNNNYSENGSGPGAFTQKISGLEVDTRYYVRAYAVTADGTTYGEQKSFVTMNGVPDISTSAIIDITNWSATGGGHIVNNGGLEPTQMGVCWSVIHNPTINDSYVEAASLNSDVFTCDIKDLEAGTTYYVRAYVSNNHFTIYGDEISFTTIANGSLNGHDYVDLGFSSGILWATCNVGSESIQSVGNYFAWGETQPKSTYSWSTYIYCMGDYNMLTKYCTDSNYGYNGFADNRTSLQLSDDAATMNWGEGWRTPTREELKALFSCTSVWVEYDNVKGMRFIGKNGNSVFLPTEGSRSYYMANSLSYINSSYYSRDNSICGIEEPQYLIFGGTFRCSRQFVRAVCFARSY